MSKKWYEVTRCCCVAGHNCFRRGKCKLYLFSSRQLTILKQMFFSPLPLFFLGLLDSKVGGVEWFSSFIVFLEGGEEEEYGSQLHQVLRRTSNFLHLYSGKRTQVEEKVLIIILLDFAIIENEDEQLSTTCFQGSFLFYTEMHQCLRSHCWHSPILHSPSVASEIWN